jgi:hypothetical protein
MPTKSPTDPLRSATVNLRLQTSARDLIDRAAAASGKSRTDFMVEASRREAEAVPAPAPPDACSVGTVSNADEEKPAADTPGPRTYSGRA